MSKAFGNHLRNLRKTNSHYSQQNMADMLKISRSTYTYYETGKSEPGQENLRKICAILDVDFNTLLGYKEESFESILATNDYSPDAFKNLSPSEEQIILAYRRMNTEEKEFIGKQITKIVKGPRY